MKALTITMKADEVAEVMLYGLIGSDFFGEGITAKEFRKELKAVKAKVLNLRINSPGGSVFEAAAMLAALDEHPARIEVDIDGIAASAASVLAMAGDTVRINAAGMLMVHNPHTMVIGGSAEMRKTADLLDSAREQLLDAYGRRKSVDRKQMGAWMDDESWFTGQQAVDAGLADSVTSGAAVAACIVPERLGYRKVPPSVAAQWAEHERRKAIAARL